MPHQCNATTEKKGLVCRKRKENLQTERLHITEVIKMRDCQQLKSSIFACNLLYEETKLMNHNVNTSGIFENIEISRFGTSLSPLNHCLFSLFLQGYANLRYSKFAGQSELKNNLETPLRERKVC